MIESTKKNLINTFSIAWNNQKTSKLSELIYKLKSIIPSNSQECVF